MMRIRSLLRILFAVIGVTIAASLTMPSKLTPIREYEPASQGSSQPRSVVMQPRVRLTGHKRSVYALAFSPDGHILATGGEENAARLWDAATGQTKEELYAGFQVHGLTFSPDGRMVAMWSYGARIPLWNTGTGELKAVLTEPKGFVRSVAFSPDSHSVATASMDGLSAHLWEAETGGLRATLDHPNPYRYANGVAYGHADGVDKVAFSPDGKTLVTTSERIIYLWDVATARMRMKLIDPDVRISTPTWRSLKGFSHGDTIYDLAISPDGRTIATASRDGTAKLWDLATGNLKAILQHEGKVLHVTFSHDSKTLATGSEDRTAHLWNVSLGKLIATLPHKGTVHTLSFSADSALIATASDNEKWANIWRVATGELLTQLPDARPPVVFSPIGRTLATASRGSDVLLWDVPNN